MLLLSLMAIQVLLLQKISLPVEPLLRSEIQHSLNGHGCLFLPRNSPCVLQLCYLPIALFRLVVAGLERDTQA
jgi:hypothetical protein